MLPRVKAHVDRASLPHFVYEFYDRHGDPVYVGCTMDLPARLATHARGPFWREVVEVHTRLYLDRSEAQSVEARLISELQPHWNIHYTEQASESARERHRQRKMRLNAQA